MEQTHPSESAARRADLEGRFVASLPDLERTIRFVARRYRLSRSEEDDFAGEVKLALIKDDYDVFAQFQGHSSLRTYLTTVVQRLFLDYRRRLWGKWRPSAAALRAGPLATRLEVLLYRDGLSVDEAVETLRTNFHVSESREELAEIARVLPARVRRGTSGESALADVPAGDLANPEVQVESSATTARMQDLLEAVMGALTPQDRVVLRLRFEDNVSVADIARLLKMDQRQLYRRIDGLLASFRKSLEERGLGWPEVERVIDRGQCHLRLPEAPRENALARPSSSGAES